MPKQMPSPIPPRHGGDPAPDNKPGLGYVGGTPNATFPTVNAYGQPAELIVDVGSRVGARKGNKGKKAEERQEQVAGAGMLLRIPYGEQRVGGGILAWGFYSGKLVVAIAWGEGEIEGVQSYTINDEAAPFGTVATHYPGSQTQGVDPTLAAMRLAQGSVFTDTWRGTAYSVFSVPPSKVSGFPRFNAIVRGLKIAATDGGTPAYSDVPAYIIANFVESWMGEEIDWDSVAAVAARNNEVIGTPSEVRNKLSITIDQAQVADQWLDILCDYAGCWWIRDNGVVRLIPDMPGDSEFTFDETNIVRDSVVIDQRDSTKSPTVVQLTWTDRSQLPWRDEVYSAYAAGVLAGTTERRVTKITRQGITRESEARRYAVQRLNEYITSDISFAGVLFDESISLMPGTIITISHPLGLVAKEMRVKSCAMQQPGRWAVVADEYDDAKYSDDVVTGGSTPDTQLPSMLDVPAITGFVGNEVIEQLQTGRWISRLKFDWTTPSRVTYPYLMGFRLQVINGTKVQSFDVPYDTLTFTTPALQENINYECRIRAYSELEDGAESVLLITNDGKLALPSDVPDITAYSVNGETRIFWDAADDRDPTSYEIRYQLGSITGSSWEDATFLAFVPWPALSFTTTLIPEGHYVLFIKLHDSVITALTPNGQESENAATCELDVVPNNTSSADDFPLTVDSLSNMIELLLGGWITSITGDTWDGKFSGVLDTYSLPLATYHTSADSELTTDAVDFGESKPATLTATMDYDDLSGSGQIYIDYKVDIGDSWTEGIGSTISVTARYARVRAKWTGTATGRVNSLGVLRHIVNELDGYVQQTILADPMSVM